MAVRLGLIGTSWIAGAFVDAARDVSDVDVVSVCSRSQDSGSRFASQFQIPRVHTDLGSLGADSGVDAVYIASPNSLHAAQAIAMLEAGKHVLVEKPLAADATQAAAMIDAARAAGRVLMEAYVSPYLPNVASLRDALPEIGTVRRAVLMKSQYSSKYDRLKAGELPNAFNPDFAGGSLMDLGFYPVSLAVHLFGAPRSIVATGVLLDSGADGQGTVVLGYDGLEVVCVHSKITPTGLGSEISGEEGVLAFDDCSVPTQVTLAPRLGSPQAATLPGFTRPPSAAADRTRAQSEHHMRYEIQEFATLIETGVTQSPRHTTSDSHEVARILDEARRQVGVAP